VEIPKDWTFKRPEVADGFDAHVREQLPWYELVTMATVEIARHYIPEGGLVYDIGASTGNLGAALEPTLKARGARLVGVEASEEMVTRYRKGERHSVVLADARAFDYQACDVVICFLSLMFLPPTDRAKLIPRLKSKIRPGGALIVVDKIQPAGGYLSTALWRLTLACKQRAGAEPASIMTKELSLAGIQRPLSLRELQTLDGAEFFRFAEFAGYVVEL
jgi:tRNA (cmo5U34)-methyltransferase